MNYLDINNFESTKMMYDKELNKDRVSFVSSNDEPTPIGCIEEMLSKIPQQAYKNKNLKILDPCCGNGNFHFVMNKILLENNFTPQEIQKSLYFNDINALRLEVVKKIFQDFPNITNCDFLTRIYNDKYDIIYANPPYAKLMENGKRSSKNHNLIRSFLIKSLDLLSDNGYLIFIIPDNWMSLSDRNDIVKILSEFQFHWLNIHGAKKWFPKIGSSFTWLVLEKTKSYQDFYVESIYKNTMYKDMLKSEKRSYIPLVYNQIIQSILSKTIDATNTKFMIQTSSDLHRYTKRNCISTIPDDTYKYKLIHTPKQTVYANRKHKYSEGYKVFISLTDKYNVFIDNCGMTQSIAFILCKDRKEALKIQNQLRHSLYLFINNICRYGNFNNIRILQRFPVPQTENIYQDFNLSQEEIFFIENFLKL